MTTTVPLVELPAAGFERLKELEAPPSAASVSLYRAIANQQEVLMGWIELSWRLRLGCSTSRRLRELAIVRSAMLSDCEYELRGHLELALASGVSREELDALHDWRNSDLFSSEERAALALSEAMHTGSVPDAVLGELMRLFEPEERVELIVTCGFYNMVPRVVDALRLPRETPRL